MSCWMSAGLADAGARWRTLARVSLCWGALAHVGVRRRALMFAGALWCTNALVAVAVAVARLG